jgi:hypothetical protein
MILFTRKFSICWSLENLGVDPNSEKSWIRIQTPQQSIREHTNDERTHCNENPIYVFLFWELRSLNPSFHIYVSVYAIYLFQGSVHI